MTNCGACSESCCASLAVTGGTYYRMYDLIAEGDGGATRAADGGPTGQADPATVSSLRLDKYEVTVGRFRQFVSAWNGGAGWLPPEGSGKHSHLNGGLGLLNAASDAGTMYEQGWVAADDSNVSPTDANLACDMFAPTWTPSAGSNESRPISCVNWYEAYAFCIWDGGFLPSESEWEYAAAGGSEQREYPWGSNAPGTGNQYAIYNCNYGPQGVGGVCTGVANVAPVGTATLGAGRWGQLDLMGSVSEWNLDWFGSYANPCVDCADLTAGTDRVFRDTEFFSGTSVPADRDLFTPTAAQSLIGFRCARKP